MPLPPLRERSVGGLQGLVAGMVTLALGWGFTVDDALISTRVAHHLATGVGYRFNPSGPVVDCVTPLGWAWLLAPFSETGSLAGLHAAQILSAGAWLIASFLLGALLSEVLAGWRRVAILTAVALCLPLGAWASSGMETSLALLFATLSLRSGSFAPLAAGLATVLRPELTPWAVTWTLGRALLGRQSVRICVQSLLFSLGPFVAFSLFRHFYFGRPAPLAVFAKPSDAAHGLRYVWGALVLSGPSFLLAATGSWKRLPRPALALPVALAVHGLVLVGVGGDWMPLWRLAVPVLPSIFLLGAHIAQSSGTFCTLIRLSLVALLSLSWHLRHGSAVRNVSGQRTQLIAEARQALGANETVAALDIGWVGAATTGTVVDLAGLTDERIAFLPGGHTSKRLPKHFLEQRDPDSMLLLLRSDADLQPQPGSNLASTATSAPFLRAVENRLSRLSGAEHYRYVSSLNMGTQHYALYRRNPRP